MASNRGKMWTVLGQEFGDNAGKSAIIARVLHSLKCVDASFRVHSLCSSWGMSHVRQTLTCGGWTTG